MWPFQDFKNWTKSNQFKLVSRPTKYSLYAFLNYSYALCILVVAMLLFDCNIQIHILFC